MFKQYANTIENIVIALIVLASINFFIIQPMAKKYEKQQDKMIQERMTKIINNFGINYR